MSTPSDPPAGEGLRRRAEAFLVQCGSCDGGLPMSCACHDGDPRPVILDLLNELARESAAATRARAEAWDEGWEYGGGVGNPPKSDNPYRAALAPDTAGESA